MERNLSDVLAALPPKRRAKVEQRAGELATLKDFRLAVEHTQQDLAASLGIGQDTISRIERHSDLLLSTLRRYIEAMGGKLDLVARFPNRPPCSITSPRSRLQRQNGAWHPPATAAHPVSLAFVPFSIGRFPDKLATNKAMM